MTPPKSSPPPLPPPSADKNFFYEATQKLCSSLQPESSIAAFYEYLTRFVPLREFLLTSTPVPLHSILIVASATRNGVECPFRRVALPPEQLRLSARLDLTNPAKYHEYIFTDDTTPDDELARFLSFPHPWRMRRPVYLLRLVRESHIIGSAFFAGMPLFNDEHLHLLRGLEGPLCLALSNMLQHWELQQRQREILHDNQRLRRQLAGLAQPDIAGAERGLAGVMEKVRQAAPVDVPVLITGETGTGKEVIARALHGFSARREQAFVPVNCGALPPALVDSALFGHVKGAFTGATEHHKGYFERAEGGTLFLDEIGELPLEAQARLLRVLETGEVEKVGGTSPRKVRIRLVAATHRDLQSMVAAGTFREDLFYRLHVVRIHLPPLRERKEDIPLLVRQLLRKSAEAFGMSVPPIPPGEVKRLLVYDWPGNVRELQNVLDEALVCSGGGPLAFGDKLPLCTEPPRKQPAHCPAGPALPTETFPSPPLSRLPGLCPTYDDISRDYFLRLLEASHWRVAGKNGAAVKAGLKAGTFRFRCGKLGIELRPGGETIRPGAPDTELA